MAIYMLKLFLLFRKLESVEIFFRGIPVPRLRRGCTVQYSFQFTVLCSSQTRGRAAGCRTDGSGVFHNESVRSDQLTQTPASPITPPNPISLHFFNLW